MFCIDLKTNDACYLMVID